MHSLKSIAEQFFQRPVIVAVFFLVPITLKIAYDCHAKFVFTPHMMNAMQLEGLGSKRSMCCLTNLGSENESTDVCGRRSCVWPCSVSVFPNIDQLNYTQDKAFLHETSGSPYLDFRQACAVESLVAYHNPNLTIHLLMTGSNLDINSPTMKTLHKYYPNVQIHNINLDDYIVNTPLERWYFCTNWKTGPFAVSHLSDALRFLSLSKYSGYYFDLDVIHIRSVTSYQNFFVAESAKDLGSCVIHTDDQHKIIMEKAVEEFATTYRRNEWAHNGPALVVRILQRWCNVSRIGLMTPEICDGFRILPPRSFFPIYYPGWKQYFSNMTDEKFEWEEDVIGAHIWNKLSSGFPVLKKSKSNQLYVHVARASCPRIFDIAPEQTKGNQERVKGCRKRLKHLSYGISRLGRTSLHPK